MVDEPTDARGPRRRRGRWRTGEESRRRILEAARWAFAEYGYDRATVRQIAAEARVDAAMVYYFFGAKPRLFAAAMALPRNPAESLAAFLDDGLDGLGDRIVRHFVEVWDDAGSFEPIFALLRSAPTDGRSAGLLRDFIERELIGQLRRALGTADAALRAELMGSQLMGLALARYVVGVEPLASAAPDTVAAWVGPVLQRYLTAPDPT